MPVCARSTSGRAWMRELLVLRGVSAGYGSFRALFDVSFSVPRGEVVALMGSNGAGKTTTLRAITGQLKLTGGVVRLAGDEVNGLPPEQLVRLGVVLVPEGRGMLRDLTVAQNLELGAYTVSDRTRIAAAFERAYSAFPILHERREQKAGTLSGGQQQMLAIGRALMSDPRLLLVDEASLGLSPIMTETAFDLIGQANREAGVTVDLAHRAYVLERGQVVDVAEGAAVRTMQGRLREAYLGKAAR